MQALESLSDSQVRPTLLFLPLEGVLIDVGIVFWLIDFLLYHKTTEK